MADSKPSGGAGRNPEVNFIGQKQTKDIHASVTDPDACLYKKVKEQQAKLCYMGHAMMRNRNDLMVDSRVSHANWTAERTAVINMIEYIPGCHRISVGADKRYDCADFVNQCRTLKATAHAAPKKRGRY